MNNTQLTARIGLFFLLGLALVWVTFETLSGGSFFKPQGYGLVADFGDLKGLKVNDDVRMAGVRIGAVTLVRLNHRQAEAVLKIDPGVQIASDATATIGLAGMLGGNFVSVDLGSAGAGPLAPGGHLKTRDTPDLNAVISQLGDVGKKVEAAIDQFGASMNGGGAGGGLFARVNDLVDTTGPKLSATIDNLQDITAKIRSGQGTLGQLVNSPDLHDQLLTALTEIKQAAAQASAFATDARAITDQIKSGQGVIGELVFNAQVGDNLRVTAQNLRDISDKLNRGQGTLGKLIGDDSLYLQAQGVMKKADRALDGMSDQAPITAVGVVASKLF